MKTLLIAIGSRGDIEPFLAVAEILNNRNEEVICCFPEQFRKITEESGHQFVGLTPKYLEMLESKEGIIAMGGKANLINKIKAYYYLFKRAGKLNKVMCAQQKELIALEKPDKIIYHIKAIYPIIHEAQNPNTSILLSPIPFMVHPVEEHAHIGFKSMGSFLNKLTYKLANYGLLKNVLSASKGLYNAKIFNSKKLLSAIHQGKTIYTISPFLFQASKSWSDKVKILGYHERDKAVNWTPEPALLEFIQKNKDIVLITFGSMVNGEPKKKTEQIIKVLARLKIPAIVNTAYGGLVAPAKNESNLIYYVSHIPYDWLLPQIDFMVHHGGSGTTHMAMKYGCPSLIIPHIIDQFLWNDINYSKGLGPKGVPINKLNEVNFESLLTDLISNPSYKVNAVQASNAIHNEEFSEELYDFIRT